MKIGSYDSYCCNWVLRSLIYPDNMIGMNSETFLEPASLVWSVWFGVLASGHDSEKSLDGLFIL